MRMDHEFEEMGHFRMLAMADDNPRSPKRLLSSIARLQCCTFKSLENVDDQVTQLFFLVFVSLVDFLFAVFDLHGGF
jgi:hypothetical protein